MKKGKWLGKDGITSRLIQEAGEEFAKMSSLLFSKCLEKLDVPENLNNVVMMLLYKKERKENPDIFIIAHKFDHQELQIQQKNVDGKQITWEQR